MKIMQAVSTYQLLELIVYKNKYIYEDDVILLIPIWLKAKISSITTLESMFVKILIFKHFPDYEKSDVNIEIINYYDNLFYDNGITIEECEEIHVAGAQYGIGSYLCLKQISFILWEEASGVISQPHILRDIEQNLSVVRMEFNDKLGIYDGVSPHIYKIFANLSTQQGIIPDNAVDFDVVLEMGTLSVNMRQDIISVFIPVKAINIPNGAVLLLTEHFANCRRLTFEEQVLIYQLYFDYFLKNETVVIKPHPDDLMYYDQLFPQAQIVKEKFPSEFMPYIFSNQPKMLATISSAAVRVLHRQFPDSMILDNDFEKRFRIIHKYYFALQIALELQEFEEFSVSGIYEPLIQILHERNNIKELHKNLPLSKVYFVDDYGNEGKWDLFIEQILASAENDCYIFLNSMEQYLFFESDKDAVWENILPIIISKSRLLNESRDFYSDLKDDYIYIYTKNIFIRERINQMKLEEKLNNTGICVEKKILDENSLQIEILKGKLKATEKRLLYYINLVNELEKKEK